LPNLLPYDVIVKGALIREDHGIIIRIILCTGILVLLLKWSQIGIAEVLGCWLLVFIGRSCSCRGVRNILFAFVVLRRLLLYHRGRWLLNLLSNTLNRLSIVEIYSLYLLWG
jgi:hypothetical protein